MDLKKISTDVWLELSSGAVGITTTIIVDWHHIAERAIETAVVAIVNGGLAAITGYVAICLMRKILPRKENG